jgi:hypothetical protein
MMPPLYRRLLGERFEELPARVRELHDLSGTSVWAGRADVERGRSWTSRMVASLLRLPPAGRDQVVRVTFRVDGIAEVWERTFNGTVFRSVQDEHRGLLRERVGPTTFLFALDVSSDGVALTLKGVRLLSVPLPQFTWPSVCTFETERNGRYCFEVEAGLPLLGLVVRYSGWLEREA